MKCGAQATWCAIQDLAQFMQSSEWFSLPLLCFLEQISQLYFSVYVNILLRDLAVWLAPLCTHVLPINANGSQNQPLGEKWSPKSLLTLLKVTGLLTSVNILTRESSYLSLSFSSYLEEKHKNQRTLEKQPTAEYQQLSPERSLLWSRGLLCGYRAPLTLCAASSHGHTCTPLPSSHQALLAPGLLSHIFYKISISKVLCVPRRSPCPPKTRHSNSVTCSFVQVH